MSRKLQVRSGIAAGLAMVSIAVPSGALGAPGDAYVADEDASAPVGDGAIFKLGPGGGNNAEVLATSASFTNPRGMAVLPDGDFLVADYSEGVLRVDRFSGAVSSLLPVPDGSAYIDVAVAAGGSILVADFNGDRILKVNPRTLATTPIPLPAATSVRGLAPLRNGGMFAVDNAGSVLKVSAAGAVTTLSNSPLLALDVQGAALSPDERQLYVAARDSTDGGLLRIDTRTGGTTKITPFPDAAGVALRPDRSLLLSQADGTGSLSAVGPGGSPITSFSADPHFVFPGDIVVEPAKCAGRFPTVVGTTRRDVLRGSRFADVISTLGGNDVVKGLGGNDVICGGVGRDRLLGGGGRDRLLGQGGPDRLVGGVGHDSLRGGPGRDRQKQ